MQGRIERKLEALENEHQVKLYDVIDEAPGLNINELASEIGLSRSATRYHIARLQKAELVVAHRQGHNRFHFTSSMPVMRCKAVFLLRLPTLRALIDMAIDSPLIHTVEMADSLGISSRSVRHNLKILENEGLIKCRPMRGRRGNYEVAFHPDLRVAWVLYCRGDGGSKARVLRRAPAIMIGIELLFGSFGLNWLS